tara:strand:+ start:203 stop:457 length:255 start_codon:yes stop_codon:yes gene_type:complete
MVDFEYHPKFKKEIERIKDGALKERVKKQIRKIIESPEIGDFLSYDFKNKRKMYVHPFRIIYFYDKEKDLIKFLDFDKRKNVYK